MLKRLNLAGIPIGIPKKLQTNIQQTNGSSSAAALAPLPVVSPLPVPTSTPSATPVPSVNSATLLVSPNSKTATKSSTDIILIYTHCLAGQFGDYAQTGEVAYALDKHCQEKGMPQQFVLTSTDEGIKKFKQLYLKNPTDQALSIHGRSFEFATLEEITTTGRASKVSHLIRVTECGTFDRSQVRKATNQNTRFLFLGAPWNTTSLGILTKIKFDQEYIGGRLAHSCMGIGANRIGLTLYNGPLEALDHKAYQNVTTNAFGFAYFKNRGGSIPQIASFAGDYMRIAYCSHYQARNYVFIGDNDDIKAGIQQLLNEYTKLRVVLHAPAHATECYTLQSDGSLHIESVSENTSSNKLNLITIVQLERVSNEQMRALMYSSIPFIGAAGVMSMLEGMALGKIVLTPDLSTNRLFYDSYDQSIRTLTSASFGDRIQKLVKLLRWNRYIGFSSNGRKQIINELDDQQLHTALSKANVQLTAVNNAENEICQALGLPLSVSPVTTNTSGLNASSSSSPSTSPAISISPVSTAPVSATKNPFAMFFTKLETQLQQNGNNSLTNIGILPSLLFANTDPLLSLTMLLSLSTSSNSISMGSSNTSSKSINYLGVRRGFLLS